MFFAGRSLVALLALLSVTSAQNSQCGSDLYGSPDGQPYQLQRVPLPAGYRDFNFKVPDYPCPPRTFHVGTRVLVCDYDRPPVVQLDSLVTGFLHRTGSLQQPAEVYTTVYCSPLPPYNGK